MITTARIIRTTIQQESGKVLVLALILLVMGSLILTPLLGLMSTGLHAGRTYENKTSELYAADAGVEAAIHWLMNGKQDGWGWVQPEPEEKVWIRDDADRLHINGKYVTVTVEELAAANTFKVTSRITGPEPGTTVMSTLWAFVVRSSCPGYSHDTFEGDLYVDDTITTGAHAVIVGDVYAKGDLDLKNHSSITGGVTVDGNITLDENTYIIGNVCAEGDITIKNKAYIEGDVLIKGDHTLTLQGAGGPADVARIIGDIHGIGNIRIECYNKATIEGNIYIVGDVEILLNQQNHTMILGDVYATGSITFTRYESVTGELYPDYLGDYPPPPECLLWPVGPAQIYTYEIS